MGALMKHLGRRKMLFAKADKPMLKKTFDLHDLIFLGVGSTLGVGIYILSGDVAKNVTGPAIILSFFLAAVISVFAGICYAEFGACAPSSGSVYSYCYTTMGEFIAFAMGWNLLSEYIIGTASVVKALSVYVDSFMNNTIETHLKEIWTIDVPYLAQYFDVLALLICILFSVLLSYGLKESVWINNVLTGLNVTLVLFFIIIGFSKVSFSNWNLSGALVPPNAGTGGFLPYGLSGVIRGAGICFYGFAGFDAIATTGGEVKNPEKTLPVAIIVTLTIVFMAYLGISTVLTLLLPYYLQDDAAPLSYAFKIVGYDWAEWVVSIGSLFGLMASLFGAFFPISRILYSMANDGLIFRSFSKIDQKRGIPVFGTLASGLITGVIASILDVDHLINLNAIGTLLAYTMIAACVIIVRYSVNDITVAENSPLLLEENKLTIVTKELYVVKSESKTLRINNLVSTSVAVFCILSGVVSILVNCGISVAVFLIIVIVFLMVLSLAIIQAQPCYADLASMPFKTPLVPFLPGLSIFLNIFLMTQFDFYTWMRLVLWLAIGLVIYFTYGMFSSNERIYRKDSSNQL